MPKLFSALLGLVLTMAGLLSSARAADPSPAAPSRELLQAPESATIAETIKLSGESVGIHTCSNQESAEKITIVCYFVLTRNSNGQYDYSVEKMTNWQPTLVDNFLIEHKLVQLYVLNGRGQQQSTVNLDKGDRVWFAAEFADGADDITTARIVFRGYVGDPQLRAPVKQPEQ